MKLTVLAGAAALSLAALTGPGAAAAAAAALHPGPHAVSGVHGLVDRHHKCTRTSSGSCILGGEFCPRADYGHSGWDAKGRRYVCKGNRTHPHWEKP